MNLNTWAKKVHKANINYTKVHQRGARPRIMRLSCDIQYDRPTRQWDAMCEVIERLTKTGRAFGLDLDGAIKEKLAFNAKRAIPRTMAHTNTRHGASHYRPWTIP